MKRNQFKPLGVTGATPWGRAAYVETDPALVGSAAIKTYDTMRRDDPTGAMLYQVLALPIRMVAWHVEPGGESVADQEAADFVWSALNDMRQPFNEWLADVCQMFIYGWAQFWIVLKRRTERNSRTPDGRIGIDWLEMVNQRAFLDWEYAEDGWLVGTQVLDRQNNTITVPLEGSLFFHTSPEGGDPAGISIYRAAVRPWTYKRRLEQVEGIGLYRRWAGFPDVELPPGATTRADVADGEVSDEERGEDLVEAIYRDEMMGVVRPSGWTLNFGGPQGNVDSTMGDTIMRKDIEMARAVLAQFMLVGLQKVGTQSLAGTLFDAFMLSIEAYLESIRDEMGDLVALLLRWNDFPGLTEPPRIEYSSPRQLDLGAVAQYLQTLLGAGLLTPDASLEAFLRSLVPGMPASSGPPVAEAAQGQAEEDELPDDEEDAAPELAGAEADEFKRFFSARARKFAVQPAPDERGATYRALADSNAAAQRGMIEGWTGEVAADIAGLPPDVSHGEVLAKLDDYILAALLLFREKSMLDIAAAFWLGFGKPSGPPEALQTLQGEIELADGWIGYGPGGTVQRTNPLGKPTLFGDIAGTLEGQIVAIMLLLKQGRNADVMGLIEDAVKSATQGYSRAELYAGHVWRGVWAGEGERRRETGVDGPVRWVLDPTAHHCAECPIFGSDPPGRWYASFADMLRYTGGTLPGHGTDCDGNCRCHLEGEMPDGGWGWL